MKFELLDNLPAYQRGLLLILCALTCCWGFVNQAILLVFASKIGFPIGVVCCAIFNRYHRILQLTWYTALLVGAGWIYFTIFDHAIDQTMVKYFVPTWSDFLLALGLGVSLDVFWNHALRINIIIMSAGLASLLPACIMTGYHISMGDWHDAGHSMLLYLQYAFGLAIGAALANLCTSKEKISQ